MLEVNQIDVFIGRKKIIKDATFNVKSGAIVGLIGPNGAGKTTIMKTILGLTKFSGRVTIDQQPVTEHQHAALQNVGALIENPAIYPFLTGTQNLKLYSKDEADMQQLVNQLEMEDYIDRKSKGYSLGMKQKLGIAIALLNHPQLVILDEPMNGLDIEATILIRNLIKQYAQQGTTFLISSHILSELEKVVSDVVLINGGEILLTDSIQNFNHIDHQHYRLVSEDLPQTIELFNQHHLPAIEINGYLRIEQADLFAAQDLLYQNHLRLLELAPEVVNFEQRVVELLRKKKVS